MAILCFYVFCVESLAVEMDRELNTNCSREISKTGETDFLTQSARDSSL